MKAKVMESALCLSPDEAQTYSKILDAVGKMPKSDPRFALIIGITWWLIHRRRRLEQQRIRRRQFFRRWRRLVLLRWELQKNLVTGISTATRASELANLEEMTTIPEKQLWVKEQRKQVQLNNENRMSMEMEMDNEEDLWSVFESGEITPSEFYRDFHMTQETFEFLYALLSANLSEDVVPGKKQLAATIYRIANNADYSKIASMFGISKNIATSLFQEVCELIAQQLQDKFLTWNSGKCETLEDRINESELTFGIPQCVGVLGSVDVFAAGASWNINKSTAFYSSPYSRICPTTVFQAVVDHDGLFTNVYAGIPSGISNHEILRNSNLRQNFLETFGGPRSGFDKTVNNIKIPVLLATDRTYPLEDWLMTPYKIPTRAEDEAMDMETEELNKIIGFNEKMSKAQEKFVEAMSKLRFRWKICNGNNGKLSYTTDGFENLTLTCCILHNICEIRGDPEVDPMWAARDLEDDLPLRVFADELSESNGGEKSDGQNCNETSRVIRNALATNIFEKNVLLKCL